MKPDDRVYIVLAVLILGMILGVILIQSANASTRHVVSIGPNGADSAVCIIDRNDQVAFRNDTSETIVLRLPWGSAVGWYQFELTVTPGESQAVGWNHDHVDADWEINGVVVANVQTTDDPVNGCVPSGAEPWRIVIGGLNHD